MTHERRRVRGRPSARAADAQARRGRPDHAARARRRVPRDRQGDGGRPLPDELLVDHPRVRGPRRRASSTPQGRELCESDSTPMHIGSLPWYIRGFLHRLGGRDRGRRRDRPQPPLPRRLALAGRRGRGADLPRRRAARLRRRDRARARRRRLVPGHQRRRVRRLRRGEDLQRAALVRARRAERGPRPDDLRQRPHRDDEPRRHERDARRLPARPRALPAARRALRRRRRDERRLRLDGLLRADAARRDREDPGRHVRPDRRLARRRRAQPRRAAARRDAGDRRGRRDHDRPDRLEPRGADRLQRAVRGLAARQLLLRGPHDPARRGRRSPSTCRRTTASSGR